MMPLLPLRDVVVFPHMIVPLFVGREKSIAALESAMKYEKGIFMVAQKTAQKDDPAESDIYDVGTIGIIIQLLRLPDGTVKVLVEGKQRGVIRQYVSTEDFFSVTVEEIDETEGDDDPVKTQALGRSIREAFENMPSSARKSMWRLSGLLPPLRIPRNWPMSSSPIWALSSKTNRRSLKSSMSANGLRQSMS